MRQFHPYKGSSFFCFVVGGVVLVSLCLDTPSSVYLRSRHSCRDVYFSISQLLHVVASWLITRLGPWVWHIKHSTQESFALAQVVMYKARWPSWGMTTCCVWPSLVPYRSSWASGPVAGLHPLFITLSLPSLGLFNHWKCGKCNRKHQRLVH